MLNIRATKFEYIDTQLDFLIAKEFYKSVIMKNANKIQLVSFPGFELSDFKFSL